MTPVVLFLAGLGLATSFNVYALLLFSPVMAYAAYLDWVAFGLRQSLMSAAGHAVIMQCGYFAGLYIFDRAVPPMDPRPRRPLK
jgi:hypothetical protein